MISSKMLFLYSEAHHLVEGDKLLIHVYFIINIGSFVFSYDK